MSLQVRPVGQLRPQAVSWSRGAVHSGVDVDRGTKPADRRCSAESHMAHVTDQLAREIADVERAVVDQVALIRSRVVRGVPSQASEDRLRSLMQKLASLKERRR